VLVVLLLSWWPLLSCQVLVCMPHICRQRHQIRPVVPALWIVALLIVHASRQVHCNTASKGAGRGGCGAASAMALERAGASKLLSTCGRAHTKAASAGRKRPCLPSRDTRPPCAHSLQADLTGCRRHSQHAISAVVCLCLFVLSRAHRSKRFRWICVLGPRCRTTCFP
jgi:hypothetical protein